MKVSERFLPVLQLFAEGGNSGEGGAEGQTTGDTAADAGRQSRGETLKALGVPDSVLNKKKAVMRTLDTPKSGKAALSKNVEKASQSEKTETAKTKPTWEELMQDADYNRQMQATVQSRLKNAMGARESLSKIAPALELMGKSYGIASESMDYAALADAIRGDSRFQFAADAAGSQFAADAAGGANTMGTEKETPAPLGAQTEKTPLGAQTEKAQTETEKAQIEKAQTRRRAAENFNSMLAQAEALKATVPGFKLENELQNPMFVKLTAPETGLSVEDAYFALHRREIQSAALEAASRQTAERLSKAVMSGSKRPLEAGTTLQAPSRIGFDYSKASPEEKEALKARIRSAALRGEKLYPN